MAHEVLLRIVESLWLQFGPFMRMIVGRIGTSEFHDDKHQQAIAAIVNNDPEALEAAIKTDIAEGIENITKEFFKH